MRTMKHMDWASSAGASTFYRRKTQMRTRTHLAITALVAATALAALISTASARNLSISNQNIRVTWSSVEFVGPTTVRCAVTLEGSFHTRTVAKVVGALIGYVTKAITRRPCTGGTAWAHSGETNEVLGGTFANNLPWHIQYGGFEGTLPNITRLRIVLPGLLFSMRAAFFGIALLCEYVTDAAHGNAFGTATRNTTTGVIDNLRAEGTIRSRTGGCPEGSFSTRAEDGIIALLGSTTKITVTLI